MDLFVRKSWGFRKMKHSWTFTSLLVLALLPSPCRAEDAPVFLLKWGSQGSGPGQFQFPVGIGVGPEGDIYVADVALNRIQRFTPTGSFICSVGSAGSGNAQFNQCIDIAFGPDNLGYVSDYFNGRFQVFDASCNYVRQWSVPYDYGSTHVAVDPSLGRVYTTASNLLLMYDTTGVYLGNWQFLGYNPSGPQPFGVGPTGTIYFPDESHSLVVAFGPNGDPIRSWGERGIGPGQLDGPFSVTVDANENVYVLDIHGRVQKFTSTGQYLSTFGSFGDGDGQFSNDIEDMCVDANGNIYVLDTGHYLVQKFGLGPTPAIRRTWGKLKLRYR